MAAQKQPLCATPRLLSFVLFAHCTHCSSSHALSQVSTPHPQAFDGSIIPESIFSIPSPSLHLPDSSRPWLLLSLSAFPFDLPSPPPPQTAIFPPHSKPPGPSIEPSVFVLKNFWVAFFDSGCPVPHIYAITATPVNLSSGSTVLPPAPLSPRSSRCCPSNTNWDS